MNAKEMKAKDLMKRAERLIAPMGTVFLATNGQGGFPDVRAVSPTRVEGAGTLWFLTSECSDKCGELTKDPRCMVYATDMEATETYVELRLWGKMEIFADADSRSLAWKDEYLGYFPGGKDNPGLRVLKFTAKSGAIQTPEGKEYFEL